MKRATISQFFAEWRTKQQSFNRFLPWRIINEYRLGVTKSADVIFFQIDIHGRCRTGKVMKYDPISGHRIKEKP